jgi:Ca2+-binding RTX toxin-like protein
MSANLSGQEPGMLIIFGTLSSDTISVTKLTDGRTRVNDNGNFKTFASGAVTSIWAVLSNGSDRLTIDSDLTIPTTLDGGSGNDSITGGSGNDTFLGGAGNDDLRGRNGNDVIYGDTGNDVIRGGNGNDSLNGDAGKDSIYGGAGRDVIHGGDNNDLLVAVGGGQSDAVFGDSGTDNFWVDSESTESVSSGSGERDLGLVHRINKFKDLRVFKGPFDQSTTPVSRDLNGQDLVDPFLFNDPVQDFSGNPLFPSTGPSLTDVTQNQVGDCYFLATLGAVAKAKPGFLERHVVDLGDGTYAVRFHGLFGDEFVRVDGDLPGGNADGTHHAGLGAENSIWVAIMEKAFAFFRKNEGTYASIEGGTSGEAFDALGISNDFSLLGFNRDGLMNRFRDDLAAGRAVTISTHLTSGSDGSPIFPKHVYVLDRVNVTNGVVTSVRLYNPHGIDHNGDDTGDSNAFDGFITVTPQQIMDNFISFNSAAIA